MTNICGPLESECLTHPHTRDELPGTRITAPKLLAMLPRGRSLWIEIAMSDVDGNVMQH